MAHLFSGSTFEMQFHYTPQQMAGSVKYHHKCRIGNWNEDTALEDESVKNFLNARETSTLTVSRLQVSLPASREPRPGAFKLASASHAICT
jgi:hypothetical protein